MGIGVLLAFTAMFGAFGARRIFRMRRQMQAEDDWFAAKERGGKRNDRGSLDFEADGGVPKPPGPRGIDTPE